MKSIKRQIKDSYKDIAAGRYKTIVAGSKEEKEFWGLEEVKGETRKVEKSRKLKVAPTK